MTELPNPFAESAALTTKPSARRRLLRRTRQPLRLPPVSPPIPFDAASADHRFDQHFDDLAFMIEVMERPFFIMRQQEN